MKIDFVKTLEASAPYIPGTIYFESSTSLIKVATATNQYRVYGGVRDASYDASTDTLTIQNGNGDEIYIDFSQYVNQDEYKDDQYVISYALNELNTHLMNHDTSINSMYDNFVHTLYMNNYSVDITNGTAYLSQSNADWNATSGVQRILNKPDLSLYMTLADYEQDEMVIAAAFNDLNDRMRLFEDSSLTYINTINTIKVNGSVLIPDSSKAVNISVPTDASISAMGYTKNALTGVSFNGIDASVTNGVASITADLDSTYIVHITIDGDYSVDGSIHDASADHYYSDIADAYSNGKVLIADFKGMLLPHIYINDFDQYIQFGTTVSQLSILVNVGDSYASYVVSRGLTSETDPVFSASAAAGISSTDITNWNNKVSNVQSDWNATSGLAAILNKPTIPTVKTSVYSFAVNDFDDLSDFTSIPVNTYNNIKDDVHNGKFVILEFEDNNPYSTYYVLTDDESLDDCIYFNRVRGNNVYQIGIWPNGSVDFNIFENYVKPSSGIPASDLATGVLPAAPGTLKTNNTAAQTASASESLSGTINLHKIAKTGTYSDLIGTPTIKNPHMITYGDNVSLSTLEQDLSNGIPVFLREEILQGHNEMYSLSLIINRDQDYTSGAVFTRVTGDTESNESTGIETIFYYGSGNWDTKSTRLLATTNQIPTDASITAMGYTKNAITAHADHKLLIGSASATAASSNTITYVESLTGTSTATHGDLTVTPTLKTITIPSAVTESTVSGWGFTKNTGTLTEHAKHKLTATNNNATSTSGTITFVESLTGTNTATSGDLTITATRRSVTIPAAANNATISIQKGGTAVDSFTVNASSNKTINIPNELPTVTASDNGKILEVVNGAWAAASPITVYSGSNAPSNSTGINGDIYIQS